ncbi:hypothetical protein FKM82_002338 [Ascaphus truei]
MSLQHAAETRSPSNIGCTSSTARGRARRRGRHSNRGFVEKSARAEPDSNPHSGAKAVDKGFRCCADHRGLSDTQGREVSPQTPIQWKPRLMARARRAPQILVLHAGGNDLAKQRYFELVNAKSKTLHS